MRTRDLKERTPKAPDLPKRGWVNLKGQVLGEFRKYGKVDDGERYGRMDERRGGGAR